MNRREFLTRAGFAVLGTAASTKLQRLGGVVGGSAPSSAASTLPGSVLSAGASECPIDTVVIVMMENRSFDHYLGWLGDDDAYLEAGRTRYGSSFFVDGLVDQSFPNVLGQLVATRSADSYSPEKVETRGCMFGDPGHTWDAGRAQRDSGFLGPGSNNDEFALIYYSARDLPIYAALARRFTVFDRWHAPLLGPTFPNRQYFLSAQSEGRKTDNVHGRAGSFHAETIVERLARAGVSVGYYHTNVPLLALWGVQRMAPYIRSLDRYFEDAAAGQLPHVAIVEPQFGGTDALRTDDHPRGDIGLGQRWAREVFGAFATSPQWQQGAFVLTYDEWGGFFDHVDPPILADARASTNDANNFGQAGFRVPTLLASPYAQPGAVDHRTYDHTSIMRFLEWRFLGAPAEGHGRTAAWALTTRDRNAHNMGRTLLSANPDPELGFDVAMTIPQPAPACTPTQIATRPPDTDSHHDPFKGANLQDLTYDQFPGATHTPWLDDITVKLA